MLEWRREADAVARFGHARTARKRVAGAVSLLAEHVWRAVRPLAFDEAHNRRNVHLGFAAVNVAQLHVARVFFGRGEDDFLATFLSRRGPLIDAFHRKIRDGQFGHRPFGDRSGVRRGSGRRRLKRRHAAGGGDDIVALRFERALENFHGCGLRAGVRLVGGQRMRAIDDVLHLRGRALPRFERVDELASDGACVTNGGEDGWRTLQRVLDDLVEQVFDGPREFTDVRRADHAARTLERVERAPHAGERIRFQRILLPGGEQLGDAGDLLAGFLYIKSEQLGIDIDRLGADGWLPRLVQRGRHALNGRWIAGGERMGTRSGSGIGQQHRGRIGFGSERRHRGNHALRHLRQRLEAGLRVVEHVPGVRAASLQRLHVVLEADHRVGEPVEVVRRDGRATGLQQFLQIFGDAIDNIGRAGFAEHEQAGLDAGDEAGPGVERTHVQGSRDIRSDRFLHAHQVDAALAEHCGLDLLEVGIDRGRVIRRNLRFRNDEPDEVAIEPVFDVDERGGDVHQRRVVRGGLARSHGLESIGFLDDELAQLAETQHAECVGDLAKHADLRLELGGLTPATDENIEYVFDLAEVLADGRGDRAHELHGRRGQILAFLLDGVVDVKQFIEPERRAHRRDLRTIAGGTGGVIEQIVEQLDRRVLRVAAFALRVELQDFAVGETEQAFDGHTGFEAAFTQRLDDGADHPPQLEHGLARGHLLELVRDRFENFEVLFRALAADPADEAELKARTQPARPLRHGERGLSGVRGHGRRLLIGLEVEQQQRAFRQQRAAAYRAQVVEQRQQHEREITPAGQHALDVARQLDHGAHERIEGFGLILLRRGRQQVLSDLLHFFGQQGGAEDFEQAQYALHLVQVGHAALQQHHVLGLFDIRLERSARFTERVVQLTADEIESL